MDIETQKWIPRSRNEERRVRRESIKGCRVHAAVPTKETHRRGGEMEMGLVVGEALHRDQPRKEEGLGEKCEDWMDDVANTHWVRITIPNLPLLCQNRDTFAHPFRQRIYLYCRP